MICCKNIVDVAFFFLIPPQILATIIYLFIFPPIFGNGIATIATKKNFLPLFRQLHCHNWFAVNRFGQQEFR